MTKPAVYILDANVFIEAAKRYYAFDIAPAFWRALLEQVSANRIVSIDRVKTEIERGNDELADWVKNAFHAAFVPSTDVDVVRAYARKMRWVQHSTQFSVQAKSDFATVADGWLVAYAAAKKCVLVTHEVLNPTIKRKVPIPNVCDAFNVAYCDTYQMLRDLNITLGAR